MKSTQYRGIRLASYLSRWSAIVVLLTSSAVSVMSAEDPFANSSTSLPAGYSGPVFQLSHNYPKTSPNPPSDRPWTGVLNGKPISKETANRYVDALKNAVASDMQALVGDYEHWDADKRGWYNQPWLSTLSEPIHGMIVATSTAGSLFHDPTLNVKLVNNFVSVYYDKTAAKTLGTFWGENALNPELSTKAAQFADGSLIVKLAFTEVSGEQWPIMSEAPKWKIYAQRRNENTGMSADSPEFIDVYLMQIDIIVKDQAAAPKTGWVFSTLVFDNRIKGGFWDQMVPLGAMWGNDPDVNSTENPAATLNETWINLAAPKYSLATLGWGGRLSGPNDQAVQAPGDYIDPSTGQLGTSEVANSSCLSCHGPAEWKMQSFLLPGKINSTGDYVMAVPGSADWMRWFQDRPGDGPQDQGSIALDYDMMFAFKALKHWSVATHQSLGNLELFMRPSELERYKKSGAIPESNYNGLPFKLR